MSWARDEWKLDLPTTALRKISELENDAEGLRKSKQQQQFQLESVSSALQKQKQLNAEEKALNSNLRREIQEWTRKCSDFESQEEKTLVDFRAKDNKIGLLDEQLRKAKAKLKDEEDKNSELLSQIDHQKLIAEAKENEIGELSEELERAKDAKAQLVKDLEVAKEKVNNLYQENEGLRDQLRQRDELLTTHSRNQSMVENEVEPIKDTADLTTADAVSNAFLEILKRENNALISDNEELKVQVDHLKSMLREKDRELERVMEKLAASHAEYEKTSQTLKTREKEIARLEAKLDRTERELRNTHNRVETLEEKCNQLYEEIQSEKRNTEETKEKFLALSRALADSENKIKTLETDLTQRLNQVKEKRDRIETLEEENLKLTQELDYLKRQNSAASESHLATNKQLREKDHRIQALEDDYKEKKKQFEILGEKVEILTSENSRLNEELERTQQQFMNTERSYRRVSKALEDCRKKFQNIDIGQDLWENEGGEGLENRNREDLRDNDDCISRDKVPKKCSNCDQLKGKLREQQNSYELKIRDLEACIRDLTAEKETLKQKVAKERRSSEEFTSRVQQMVQQLENEQNGNQSESDENRRGQLQEKENFFDMVKRFFMEHEGLKDQAQKCLSDLQQLQIYFQGCSNGAKDVISNADAFETVAKRMLLLKSLLESVVSELGRPLKEEESDAEENEGCLLEASIRAEMSWDDYEREVTFKTFKGDVEDILQQLETDKKQSEKKAEELHEVKRAHLALRKVRKRSRQAIERTVMQNEIEEFHEEEPGEDNQKGPQETNTRIDSRDGEYLVEVIKQLLDQNREQMELKMSGYFNSLEKTIKQQHVQPILLPDERRQKFGSENVKEAIDGKYAIGELDLVKRKLTDVQKSIKHLIGSLAEVEHEKNSVESKVDLLNGELTQKQSQYEAVSEDLKRATETASGHEILFQNRLDALSSEKDQINSELRRVVGILKEKELELVVRSQQLKQLQTAFKDQERAMKNKLDSLEQENNGLWLDYKEADKRAEIKEKEFKELSERLKKSQGYIHSVFSSLTNMDDELQKARDIEVFSEQEFK